MRLFREDVTQFTELECRNKINNMLFEIVESRRKMVELKTIFGLAITCGGVKLERDTQRLVVYLLILILSSCVFILLLFFTHLSFADFYSQLCFAIKIKKLFQ